MLRVSFALTVLAFAMTCWPNYASAQDSKRTQQAASTQNPQDGKVQEVGGRLVLSGETVVVTGNAEEPPRDSSIATKIETPLLETPRSISVIDRRMLDDLGAITSLKHTTTPLASRYSTSGV